MDCDSQLIIAQIIEKFTNAKKNTCIISPGFMSFQHFNIIKCSSSLFAGCLDTLFNIKYRLSSLASRLSPLTSPYAFCTHTQTYMYVCISVDPPPPPPPPPPTHTHTHTISLNAQCHKEHALNPLKMWTKYYNVYIYSRWHSCWAFKVSK